MPKKETEQIHRVPISNLTGGQITICEYGHFLRFRFHVITYITFTKSVCCTCNEAQTGV